MSQIFEANDTTFEDEVLKADGLVLVDFSATWCAPCKKLEPIVHELAGDYDGRLKVVKVDVDQARAVAARFGVMSVPTLLFFKNGEPADQVTGVVPGETLKQKLDRLLS